MGHLNAASPPAQACKHVAPPLPLIERHFSYGTAVLRGARLRARPPPVSSLRQAEATLRFRAATFETLCFRWESFRITSSLLLSTKPGRCHSRSSDS